MCNFLQINSKTINSHLILRYIPFVNNCMQHYRKYFCDDFCKINNDTTYNFAYSKTPCFYIITKYSGEFAGFAYLDNFIGDENKLFSAELTTCFDKTAWGSFTRYSAKFFLKKCFDELGIEKIKAQIYPDNFRVKKLLSDCGFEYECTLKNDTLRNGKFQDISVYGLYRSYYYKNK